MGESRTAGLALVAAGVVLNNYVYIHDLVVDKHDGFIYVGAKSVLGIAVALVLVGVGLRALVRAGRGSSAPPA